MNRSRTLLLPALFLLVPLRWYVKQFDTEADTGFFVQINWVVWLFLILTVACLLFFALDRLLHKRLERVGVAHPLLLGVVAAGAGLVVAAGSIRELLWGNLSQQPLLLLQPIFGVLTGLMLVTVAVQLFIRGCVRLNLWLTLPPVIWQAFAVIQKYVNNSVSLYIFDYVAEIFMVCAFWVFWIAHSRLMGEYDEEHKAYSMAVFFGCCAGLLGLVLAIPQCLVPSSVNMGQWELYSTIALSCYAVAFVLSVKGARQPRHSLRPLPEEDDSSGRGEVSST